ncbi:MAG: hypothetical protein FJZ47_00090, partial [Candidatus Tectomicrobia bacterium]|nr:hypothetical protein [Candidatus Tectomicrobia bacterium]
PLTLPIVSEAPAAPAAAVVPHLVGEYKPVSVLCCGLPDVPVLAARLGPEGLYHRLQTIVELMQEVIQPYDGTLLPPTSEGVIAVFGAPVAQEDHARRAVLAALALHQRLRADAARRAQCAETALVVQIGVHSGLVVVGGLGQDPQRLSTVVGAPAHLALRLQQQAAPGTILLSAATYQLVQAEVRVDPCGTLAVDGRPTPMPVYTVQGRVGRHAGVAGRGRRDQSPFVGRAQELGRLDEHLAAARAGQGQVVGLVGEPGMGKTRLLAEFCRRVPADQVTVYTGQCLSYGQATPYLPVRDLVQQVCGLAEGDTAAMHTAAIQRRLHASGITADDDVALLLQLLDLPVTPEALARRSPEGRQARTFALLRHLLLDAAQQQPLVLVMENLHWSDTTSAAWLTSLVERLAGAAVLLLGTYRPGYQPAWGTHVAVTQIVVPPLHAQESRTVVQAVLGAMSLSEGHLRTMVARAGGQSVLFGGAGLAHPGTEPLDRPGGRSRHRARRVGGPPRPAAPGGQAPGAERGGHRHGGTRAAVAGDCRVVRGRPPAESDAPPGRGVPLRDAPRARPGLHLQARADPGGRLSVTAHEHPAAGPPAHCAGVGSALSRDGRDPAGAGGPALHGGGLRRAGGGLLAASGSTR